MSKEDRIFIAGHGGMVGSALVRKLRESGYTNLITRTRAELDLIRQGDVRKFFESERVDQVYLAAAKVGGILVSKSDDRSQYHSRGMARRRQAAAISRIKLYLSQNGSAADGGKHALD